MTRDAIVGNGGAESGCGWCKDKWGLSWQITPRVLLEATTDSDRAAAKRATRIASPLERTFVCRRVG
jgi:predicted 3-demethylubiquinone-9 3-methyltransferase (glyoxalase superfamily)